MMGIFRKPKGEPKKSRDRQQKAAVRDIQEAFDKKSSMDILYKSKKGIVARKVDPYEQRDGALWAFCHTHGKIHRFYTARIVDTNVLDEEFKPKWPIRGRV